MLFSTGRLPLPRKGKAPEPRRSWIDRRHYIHSIEARVWEPSSSWKAWVGRDNEETAYEIRLHSSISLNRGSTYGGTTLVLNQRDVRNLMKALRACMPSAPESPMLVEIME